uniref:Uncharacterized protein n=1 Tax=Ananas comosus var. bracteatus TaxID=296719 RepID=A0A6V7QAT1_ANACO|nr:unnamed protein product [Ananas comosus var. bracteatus]
MGLGVELAEVELPEAGAGEAGEAAEGVGEGEPDLDEVEDVDVGGEVVVVPPLVAVAAGEHAEGDAGVLRVQGDEGYSSTMDRITANSASRFSAHTSRISTPPPPSPSPSPPPAPSAGIEEAMDWRNRRRRQRRGGACEKPYPEAEVTP